MYSEHAMLREWGAEDTLSRKIKDRKKRALLSRRNISTGRFVPKPVPVDVPVFETTSGILAYRKFKPNLLHLGLIMTQRNEGEYVTLPWVSILR